MPPRKAKADEKAQFERFIETTKRIGASETDEALEQAIKKIAPPKQFEPPRACPLLHPLKGKSLRQTRDGSVY